MVQTLRPSVRAPGLSNSMWWGPYLISILVSSEETGNEFCVLRVQGPAGFEPPAHRHKNEDELLYVLRGQGVVEVGDRQFIVGPDSLVFMPRGVDHRVRWFGPDVTYLMALLPGQFETWFRWVGRPADFFSCPPLDECMDLRADLELGREFGVECLPLFQPCRPGPTGAQSPALASPFSPDGEAAHVGVPVSLLSPAHASNRLRVTMRALRPGRETALNAVKSSAVHYVRRGEARFLLGFGQVDAQEGSCAHQPQGVPCSIIGMDPGPAEILTFSWNDLAAPCFSGSGEPKIGMPE